MSRQIVNGKILRSIRHRNGVNQAIALANREDQFREDAKRWRSEYKWRMKPLWLKMLLSSLVTMGVATSWWWCKTIGGPLPDAPPDP